MLKALNSRVARGVAVVGTAMATVSAHAAVAAPDAAEVVTYIEGLWAPIAAIGAALLTIHFGIKGYKMLRRV